MTRLRPAAARGHARHGWLDSWHSFSFGDYRDPAFVHFGPLRVINEDRVQAGQGFPTHGHEDMEIISWVLDGELAHRDSLGNGSVIRPGEAQRMSAGRGVRHSEFNPSKDNGLHFLQIWIIPDVRGIEPEYEQRAIEPGQLRGRLQMLASGQGEDGAMRIHQDARLLAGRFDGNESARLVLPAGRLGYVHVARGAVVANGQALATGDGLFLEAEPAIELGGGVQAEVLVFDLPAA
jgi:redox-sensitive bicupin YhaK (pirin superfamily)